MTPTSDLLDSPETNSNFRTILRENVFLRQLYGTFYVAFAEQENQVKHLPGISLEIGSGGGFLKEIIPDVITSDVCPDPQLDRIISANQLPYQAGEIRIIFLLHVLHHLPSPEDFFSEVSRVLIQGGRLVMIEPARSAWSRILYRFAHHEPFDDSVRDWRPYAGGRMTGSNQALPWIIFERDRQLFEKRFPQLQIQKIEKHNVLSYCLSGGFSRPSFLPASWLPVLLKFDDLLSRFAPACFPIFETIVINRR